MKPFSSARSEQSFGRREEERFRRRDTDYRRSLQLAAQRRQKELAAARVVEFAE